MPSESPLLPVAATGELRHPGLRRDERGVVIGRECLLRFPGLSDLLSFLRLQALRGDLNAVLPELEVQSLLSESGGNDFALRLAVRSSRDVEPFLEPAQLCGGQVFVGDGRVFVPFRSADAPFGYDLAGSDAPSRGLLLHRPTGSLRYPELRRIDLADLVFSLPLLRSFAPVPDGPLFLQVPPGLYRHASDYLLRHAQGTEIALLEVGPQERSYLFSVKKLSPVGLKLLGRIPGLRILARVLDNVLLPLGWRHPLPLESMSSLQPRDGMLVLQAPEAVPEWARLRGRPLQPSPPLKLPGLGFHPHLPPLAVGPLGAPLAARPIEEPPQRFGVNVTLVANGRKEEAAGLLIPGAQHEILRRILQSVPSSVLEGCSLAAGSDVAVVLGPSEALRCLPLGILLKARTERLYLPVGTRLVPDPPPDALGRMFVGPPEGDYIVLTPQTAYHFPARALLPLSRLLVARFYSRRISLLTHPLEAAPASVDFQPTLSQRLGQKLLDESPED